MLSIKEIYKQYEKLEGSEVEVYGWVRTIRDSKALGFIELNDGTFFKNMQIVFEESHLDNFKDVCRIGAGSGIYVRGIVILTPDAKQPFEINAREIKVEGDCPPDYPLQKKRHTNEYLRTIAHLRPRTNTYSAVFRVRSAVAYAIHKFFQEKGFVYVHTPIITGSDAEGAGQMFQVTTLDLNDLPKTEDG